MEAVQVKTEDESEELILADVVVKEEYSVEKSSSPQYEGHASWEQDLPSDKADIKPELGKDVEPQEQFSNKKQKRRKKPVVGVKSRKKFKCSICEKKYTSYQIRRTHFKKMHPETIEMPVRSLLKQGRPSNIVKLVPSLLQSNPNKVTIIPIKNQLLKQNSSAHKRSALKYSPQIRYECGICYEKFSNEIETHDHILENHVTSVVDEDTYKVEHICPFCDKRFARRVLMSAHLLGKHIAKKPIACTYCGTEFKSHDELSKHFSVCSKLFHCEVCQRPFNTKPGLAAHSQVHKKHKNNGNTTEDSNNTLPAAKISVEPLSVQEEPQSSEIEEIGQSESEQPKRIAKVFFVECQMESYLQDMKKKITN
ncbi:zinc finger and BTB domain-containing protein 17-like [Phlebotomus papatasi]|uniref:zinc finger and BTB domain-containing protein 17-like n=1 Tax=Phlebotomus papatasi TaxID=29031 RepID=UPI002484070D|nr:zinc finger and BTB domain-containing protein 17-like [Phlebotomus papatasi]